MKDIVLIPAFARPEYLYLCLDRLRMARGGREKHVWIAQDRHKRDSEETLERIEEVARVARHFEGEFADLRFIQRAPHSYVGNVFNVLELYRAAFQTDARFVYLIEDDVLVGKDFFEWHEAAQARTDYFCTVGWHCIRNPERLVSDDPEGYIESERDFSSIGVCWKRENLAAIAQHAREEYYRDLPTYLKSAFPGSPIHFSKWTEQAGLIMRVLLSTPGAVVAWPVVARCAHVGISGYHRQTGHKFTGTVEQRIAALNQAIRQTETLVGLSRDTFDDVSAIPEVQPWQQLKVVQRFEGKQHA